MYDPKKGFDPFELIFDQDNTSTWNFSGLNSYIQGIIEQSLKGHFNMFKNQANDGAPPLPMARGQTDEPRESDNLSPEPNLKEQAEPLKPQPYTRSIGIQPEVMRTHNMVVIRIQLPEGIGENDLKISINDDHAVIRWPAGYVEQLVLLPADIERSRASAAIKDRILEIQIPRKHLGEFREISI